MFGIASAVLSYAKNSATAPGAVAVLSAAHTALAGYSLSQSAFQALGSARETRDAMRVVAENARPQVQSALGHVAQVRNIRVTMTDPVTHIDSPSERTA